MSLPKKIRITYFIVFLLPIFLLVPGCDRLYGGAKYSETRMVMGTFVRLDVCRDQIEPSKVKRAYVDVWKRMEDISSRMTVFNLESDVARVNSSGGDPVLVGEDTYNIFVESKAFSRLTEGAFDITVGPLIDLWQKGEQNGEIPTQEAILETLSAVGLEHVQLHDGNRVKLLNRNVRLDLGAVAKGYAVDEAARLFRQHRISRFFIDAGGDTYAGGMNCSGEPWRIGIRDPRDGSKIKDILRVVNKAVVTSGDYEQYYLIDGQRWSHIMNPKTGYPEREVTSATVIADKAMPADALATALCVLGAESGTPLVDRFPGVSASLILTRQASGGLKEFESKEYKKYKYKE